MPHVALEPGRREARLSTAAARWTALLAARPDLEPAVTLQRELIGIVVDLAEGIDGRPLPRLSLPARYLAAKLVKGTPVMAGEPIPVPVAYLQPALLTLCDALSQSGAGEAAGHIRSFLADGRIDSGSLLTASLSRDQHAIRSGASHRGLSPDLVWLVAELAVSPFAHALQRTLFASEDAALVSALDGWSRGYCPACGSWPALAEVVAGRRVMRCSFCASGWDLPVYSCVYCGEGGEGFVTAAPVKGRDDQRLEVCGNCGGYLKTIDVPAHSPFPLLAIADLETLALDAAAAEHGYQRPPLKEFAAKKPA